jgi:hypothetical protein
MGDEVLSVAAILDILRSGNFDPLIGTIEDARIEAKGEPYQLSGNDRQKQELAKDVSALANAGGGIIVIGFRTKIDPLMSVERIDVCRPFDPSSFSVEQHHKVLQDWVCPSVPSVQIDYYPSLSSGKGAAAIVVPPEATNGRPYVVTRTVEQDGRVNGTLIGYYERVNDRVPTMSATTLRAHLKDGFRFQELSERLATIEATMAKMLVDPPSVTVTKTVEQRQQEITQRINEARTAVDRCDKPNIILTADVLGRCRFPRLFYSRDEPVVKILENPPILRQNGFRICGTSRGSSIVRAELRRSLALGQEVIDLWQDGVLVAVGPGDYNLLCWARPENPDKGLFLRNFILTEVTLNFVRLASEIFKYGEPKPPEIAFTLQLENMTVNGYPCVLSTGVDNAYRGTRGRERNAPGPEIRVTFETSFDGLDEGIVTFELLAKVYGCFGFEYDLIPYVEDDKNVKRITTKSLLIDAGAVG